VSGKTTKTTEEVSKAVRRRARRSLDGLSEAERMVITLWMQGNDLRAIAEKTSISIAITARTLKRVQKKIIEELFEEIDEIAERMRREQEETERLQTETRSNISELQRMVAA
jgi:hypothetical protein